MYSPPTDNRHGQSVLSNGDNLTKWLRSYNEGQPVEPIHLLLNLQAGTLDQNNG